MKTKHDGYSRVHLRLLLAVLLCFLALLILPHASAQQGNFEDFRRAVEEFADHLSSDDRISLVKFDDRVELLQDWTQSRVQLRRSLRRITPGVFTRFYDALMLSAREQFQNG